ncbi:Predicted PurR-regulated permease PerM [Noviherbaspirillum humi]|uniref:Predicted PurR-regulated permease PerM n=1 Tax=Noviherbaspirillum humi TaxID=1688639 RepID=A0A239BRJ8_9BURK|nr:AI-2E family transporter [Noviherbaspirillum humi]SNS10041.1 Predicted PurR-regulated permease PerM [Noviherbaspirillum humi]
MSHLPRSLLPLLFAGALLFLLNNFLPSLAWAGLLATVTWPLHQRLVKRGFGTRASAAILVVALIACFAIPSALLLNTLRTEIVTVVQVFQTYNQTGLPPPDWLARLPVIADAAQTWWHKTLAVPGGLNALLKSTVGDLAPQITSRAGAFGSTFLANLLYLFLAMLTLFILYLEADTVVRYVDGAGLRLAPQQYPMLRQIFPLSVRGTALGLCSVAVLEGVVLGVAYKIAGAPAPALLGVITGYMALIPGGAPLSFTLVSLLLLGQGNSGAALGLFSWGAFELFLVDKFLRPQLIGSRVDLPFLAVLFGLLGGVSTLGIIGLFVGPFLMAVLFAWLRDGQAVLEPAAPSAEVAKLAEVRRVE